MLALQDGRSGSFVLLDLQKNQVDSLKGCKTRQRVKACKYDWINSAL